MWIGVFDPLNPFILLPAGFLIFPDIFKPAGSTLISVNLHSRFDIHYDAKAIPEG
jgi:hypothetical protein